MKNKDREEFEELMRLNKERIKKAKEVLVELLIDYWLSKQKKNDKKDGSNSTGV